MTVVKASEEYLSNQISSYRLGKLCPLANSGLSSSYHILMDTYSIRVLNSECTCSYCDPHVHSFLSYNMEYAMKFFSGRKKPLLFSHFDDEVLEILTYSDHYGELGEIFKPLYTFKPSVVPELQMPIGKPSNSLISKMISMAGSGVSIASLAAMFSHLIIVKGYKLGPKRCQIGIILSKLIFYLALCGGTIFKRFLTACIIFAISTHYGMLVSFGQVIWFSARVAYMLWELNHNIASCGNENKNEIKKKEIAIFVLVWLVPLLVVISLWFHDQFVDDHVVKYGRDQMCILTGPTSKYFVVVPAITMVAINFGSLIFTIYQYKSKSLEK